MSDRLSDDDLAYYRKALHTAQTAQAILNHLGQHLADKHKLQGTDRIDDDGNIVRGNAMTDNDAD